MAEEDPSGRRSPLDAKVEHPLGEWVEGLFPGVVLNSYWTPEGIYLQDFNIPRSQQGKSLKPRFAEVLRTVFAYSEFSGETILAHAGENNSPRLIRAYIRAGAAWDADRAVMVYPPNKITGAQSYADDLRHDRSR